MRIAHLTPTFFSQDSVIGGGERYVYNLVKAINGAAQEAHKEITQTVISVGNRDTVFSHENIEVRILKNISPYAGNMDGLSEHLWTSLDGFDLVHIHQSLTLFGAFSTAVAHSLSIPIVSTDLGGGSNELMLFGKGLELCDAVLSISNYAKSLISANYSGNHRTIIGPVDTAFFRPDKEIHRDAKKAICVSRILPHKGIDRIISALPESMSLLIVGRIFNQAYFELLKDMARNKQVEFIHNANDERLLGLYRRAGIFLQASTHKDYYGNVIQKPELMGLTTLEAMSCGLPAIVSNAGSLPELVPDQRFGQVFSSDDDLKHKLLGFNNGDWPERDVEKLARDHVVNNYSFSAVGINVLELYEATLDRHQLSPTGRQ